MKQWGRRRFALILLTMAALGVTPFLVAARSGQTSHQAMPACGDTLTASVTFTADLTGCAGRGLIVGANGITINLNGHTLSGSSSMQGIYNGGFNSVTIENGTIEDFQRGVEIDGGNGTRMLKLRVTGNTGTGLFTFYPATISNSLVWGNGAGGIAVGCCVADKSIITNNVVNDNTGAGITVSFTAVGSVVSGNHALSNTDIGLDITSAGTTVTNNVANANGSDGMVLNSTANISPLKASKNTANNNTGLGINFGAADTDGGGNRASGNGTAHQCENIVCS